MQAHEPLRQQHEVVGHAVRAMYLYSAAADLAYELKDEELAAVCKNLWQDLCRSKLYLTGGLGSSAENEGFTEGLRPAEPGKLCRNLRCDFPAALGSPNGSYRSSTADTPI